jgi:hypothetical protein
MNEPSPELEHVEVDVEPLGDPRWARIERGMFAKLEQPVDGSGGARRRGWIAGAVAAAAVAAAALLLVGGTGGPLAHERASDPVRLVTTGSPSSFTVGESSLWIQPSSLVLVSGDDEHGIDVVLDRGTVTCQVAPRRGRPPFVVDAGEVRVRVVGTRFTVARGASETSVDVDHGVVEVAVGGMVTVLHDGEHWPATAPAVTAPTVPAPSVALPVEVPEASASRVPVPTHAHATNAPALAPPPALTPAPSALAPALAPAPPSPQRVFESAARIERTRPDEAAARYRELAAGGTAWAASALFALGRLEADRGRQPEAKRALEDYLARYPQGLNAADARNLLQPMQ